MSLTARNIGARHDAERRRARYPRLGLTKSMWRRIEHLVHTSGDFCVCGRLFVDQENVVTGFDIRHRLILAGGECRGRIKIPVIRSIYSAPRIIQQH